MGPGIDPATKAYLESVRLDLKADTQRLDQKTDRIAIEVIKTQARIDAVEQTLRQEMRENTGRILNAIDKFAEKAEAYDRKTFSHGDILQAHEAKLQDHDRRLRILEP